MSSGGSWTAAPQDAPGYAASIGASLGSMAHHKRKRAKHRRSGCLLCKPHKLTANAKAGRRRAERAWTRHERIAQ